MQALTASVFDAYEHYVGCNIDTLLAIPSHQLVSEGRSGTTIIYNNVAYTVLSRVRLCLLSLVVFYTLVDGVCCTAYVWPKCQILTMQ